MQANKKKQGRSSSLLERSEVVTRFEVTVAPLNSPFPLKFLENAGMQDFLWRYALGGLHSMAPEPGTGTTLL